MGSAIKSKKGDRENEKRVEKLRPVGRSKAMTASWYWGCHLTSITKPFWPHLGWRASVCAGHCPFLGPLAALPRSAWLPANCISQAPLPTGFWLISAKERHWEETGERRVVKSRLPSPFLFSVPSPSSAFCGFSADMCLWLPGVWEHSLLTLRSLQLCVGGEEQLAAVAHLYTNSPAHLAFQCFQHLLTSSRRNSLYWNGWCSLSGPCWSLIDKHTMIIHQFLSPQLISVSIKLLRLGLSKLILTKPSI